MSPDVEARSSSSPVTTIPAVVVNYDTVARTVDHAEAQVVAAQMAVALLGNVGLWIADFPCIAAADHLREAHHALLRMRNAVEAAR